MDVGPAELLIVLVVVVLLFGSKKIPDLARSLGQAAHEFRKGAADDTSDTSDAEVAARTDEAPPEHA
jgi:sec-independent protein translocase protein TatA